MFLTSINRFFFVVLFSHFSRPFYKYFIILGLITTIGPLFIPKTLVTDNTPTDYFDCPNHSNYQIPTNEPNAGRMLQCEKFDQYYELIESGYKLKAAQLLLPQGPKALASH